jgi:heptosyltransferase-2
MTTPDPATVERLVVRPPNWLGDAVLALPALAAIRRHFAGARLTVAASPSVAALFREDTDVRPDRVIELPARTRDAVAALEGEGFNLGILFPNSFRSAWQFWRARIPARWAYATSGRGLLLTQRSQPTAQAGVRHQVDYYRDLVRGLGIACEGDTMPRIAPKHPSIERASALLASHGLAADLTVPLVGFAPGAAYGQAKQWPPQRMAEVIARLGRERGAASIIFGAAHDRDAGRAIESWLRAHAPDMLPHVVDLIGRTSLGSLVATVQRVTAFVSNDSGAMHLAAALGRPVVSIFGPTDERATRPVGAHDLLTAPVRCRPCMLRDCPIDHRCMRRISVDAVFDAVSARLSAAVR